jgi:hypothetical protein
MVRGSNPLRRVKQNPLLSWGFVVLADASARSADSARLCLGSGVRQVTYSCPAMPQVREATNRWNEGLTVAEVVAVADWTYKRLAELELHTDVFFRIDLKKGGGFTGNSMDDLVTDARDVDVSETRDVSVGIGPSELLVAWIIVVPVWRFPQATEDRAESDPNSGGLYSDYKTRIRVTGTDMRVEGFCVDLADRVDKAIASRGLDTSPALEPHPVSTIVTVHNIEVTHGGSGSATRLPPLKRRHRSKSPRPARNGGTPGTSATSRASRSRLWLRSSPPSSWP